MRKAILLKLLFTAICLAQATSDPPKLGSLSGAVANLAGQPLKNATVRLQAAAQNASGAGVPNAQPLAYSSSSDAQGNFFFENIEPGRYTLSAERTGYLHLNYSANTKVASSLLDLTSAQQVTGIALVMTPQGLVAGRISNEDGEPFPSVRVAVERWAYVNGRKQLQPAGRVVVSDADGAFAIGDLPAGTYYIDATAPNAMAGPLRQERRGREGPKETYVPTYFPSALDLAGASPVQLPAGAVARGLDIRMRQTIVYRVRGKLVDPSSSDPPPTATVSMMRQDGMRKDGANLSDPSARTPGSYRNGTFEFSGVLPGTYVLQATSGGGRGGRGNGGRSIGSQMVSVGSGDVDGIVVRLGQGADILGHITADGPPPAAAPGAPVSNAALRIILADLANSIGSNALVNDDGTFVLQGVLPELYRVNVQPLPPGGYVKSTHFGSQDVTNAVLDLSSGTGGKLEILVSYNSGDVSGVVHDPDPNGTGQPLNGVTVTLWTPGTPPENVIDFTRTITTDANGQFKFSNLPPGEYRVAAWEQIDQGLGTVPEFRVKFESKAIGVTLHEHDHAQIEPVLIPRDAIEAEASKLE